MRSDQMKRFSAMEVLDAIAWSENPRDGKRFEMALNVDCPGSSEGPPGIWVRAMSKHSNPTVRTGEPPPGVTARVRDMADREAQEEARRRGEIPRQGQPASWGPGPPPPQPTVLPERNHPPPPSVSRFSPPGRDNFQWDDDAPPPPPPPPPPDEPNPHEVPEDLQKDSVPSTASTTLASDATDSRGSSEAKSEVAHGMRNASTWVPVESTGRGRCTAAFDGETWTVTVKDGFPYLDIFVGLEVAVLPSPLPHSQDMEGWSYGIIEGGEPGWFPTKCLQMESATYDL